MSRVLLPGLVRADRVDLELPQLRRHRLPSCLLEQPTLRNIAKSRPAAKPAITDDVRESIEQPGKYLASSRTDEPGSSSFSTGWSRIGRSRSADIRLDDPTVSRRHAVVVQTPEGELRVLDDRSMNGISVNGEPVD